MNQSLKSLIKLKEKEWDEDIGDKVENGLSWAYSEGAINESEYRETYKRTKEFIFQSIQSAYQLAIKDVEKMIENERINYGRQGQSALDKLQSLLKEKV